MIICDRGRRWRMRYGRFADRFTVAEIPLLDLPIHKLFIHVLFIHVLPSFSYRFPKPVFGAWFRGIHFRVAVQV
jgi:hypothetical protein